MDKIHNEFIESRDGFELTEEIDYVRVCDDGSKSSHQECMLMENTVAITINGREAGSVPCTPQLITELVIGWMNAEGYIDSMRDVTRIEISEDGTSADVRLDDRRIDDINSGRPMESVAPIKWRKEWIFNLVEDFEALLPLRKSTMAAHNCRLAIGREDGTVDVIFRCEDIGRHSAMDKAIGWAMRNGVDMRTCLLFTSGRISRAMVQKVIRAGIPVMAGKGTVSGRAVQLAGEKKLTLIGHSKKDSICIFAQPK